MVKKITTITEAQKARFPHHVKKWVDIALCTDPTDFKKVEDAALKMYDLTNIARPKYVLRANSPYSTTMVGIYAYLLLKQVHDENINYELWKQARTNTHPNKVLSDIIHYVWNNVGKSLNINLDIKRPPKYTPKYNLVDGIHNYRGGSFWANWCSYISFFRDEMGWENEYLANFALEEALISAGWIWWHEDILVIGNRPEKINLDDQGQLHCEDGPAILYRDGWSLWAWHGLRLPNSELILHPEKITEDSIESEKNQEIRRVMIERYGYTRYMSKSTVFQTDKAGKLRRRRNKNGDDIVVVEVLNGSPEPDGTYTTYFLAVPPTMKTATEAVAWTYGFTAEEYQSLQQRT